MSARVGRGRRAVVCCVSLLGLVLQARTASAQTTPPTRTWLAAGLGAAGDTRDGGAAAVGMLVVQRQPHHIALRGLVASDVFASDACEFGEIGVLYGRTITGRVGHAAISTGLSAVRPPGCRSPTLGNVGMPVVAEAALRPFPVIGIGLQAFVTLNRLSTYGGVALFVQLGWMPH